MYAVQIYDPIACIRYSKSARSLPAASKVANAARRGGMEAKIVHAKTGKTVQGEFN